MTLNSNSWNPDGEDLKQLLPFLSFSTCFFIDAGGIVNREGCVYLSKTAFPLIVARSTSPLKRSTETVDVYASEFSLGASRLNRLAARWKSTLPANMNDASRNFPRRNIRRSALRTRRT